MMQFYLKLSADQKLLIKKPNQRSNLILIESIHEDALEFMTSLKSQLAGAALVQGCLKSPNEVQSQSVSPGTCSEIRFCEFYFKMPIVFGDLEGFCFSLKAVIEKHKYLTEAATQQNCFFKNLISRYTIKNTFSTIHKKAFVSVYLLLSWEQGTSRILSRSTSKYNMKIQR